jgi:hypothetical protein
LSVAQPNTNLHKPRTRRTGNASSISGSIKATTGIVSTNRTRKRRKTSSFNGKNNTNPNILKGSSNRKPKALNGKSSNSSTAGSSFALSNLHTKQNTAMFQKSKGYESVRALTCYSFPYQFPSLTREFDKVYFLSLRDFPKK